MKKIKVDIEIVMSDEDYNEIIEQFEEGETFSSVFQDAFSAEYESCTCTHTVEDAECINPPEHEQTR